MKLQRPFNIIKRNKSQDFQWGICLTCLNGSYGLDRAYINPSLAYTAEMRGVKWNESTGNKIEKCVKNQSWKHILWGNEKKSTK